MGSLEQQEGLAPPERVLQIVLQTISSSVFEQYVGFHLWLRSLGCAN